MLKRLPVLFLLLAVPWLVFAQHLGAVVVSHDYDSAKNTVTLHMVNNTTKDITGFNIFIKETYSNGQVNEHQSGEDMVGVMLTIADPSEPDQDRENLRQMYHGINGSTNGAWQAGTSRDLVLYLQPGLVLTDYQATIDTILYADKTAETTNKDALNRALDMRKNVAVGLEAADQAIQKALANPADQNPMRLLQKKWKAIKQFTIVRTLLRN